MAYALLLGAILVLYSVLKACTFLCSVAFSFLRFIWWLARGTHWGGGLFALGLVISFSGGSLVMRALCTPTPAACFTLVVVFLTLFLVDSVEASDRSAVTRAVLTEAKQDVFPI